MSIEPLKEGELEKMTEEQKEQRLQEIFKAQALSGELFEEDSLEDEIKELLMNNFKDAHESSIDTVHKYIMDLIVRKYGEE